MRPELRERDPCANSTIYPSARFWPSPSATRRRTRASSPISPTALHDDYPASAKVFDEMAAEENGHRRRLIDLFVSKFGNHIPLVRRQDIRGYIPRKPVWQMRPLGIDTVRSHARDMERAAARFYRQALTRATDASTRKLLGDLAEEEEKHDQIAAGLEEQILTDLRPRRRSRERAPAVCLADHPAWPRRPDGRFGVDTGAGVRRRLRDPQFVERVSRRARRLDRRRHFDGLRRGAVGRRQAFRARRAAAARPRLRAHDDGWGHRPHPALPDPVFLHGDGHRARRRRHRIDHHRLDPMAIHGRAAAVRRPQK